MLWYTPLNKKVKCIVKLLKFHSFYSFSLKEDLVQLWHIELDKLFNIKEINDFLSSDEQERANRFIFDIHRQRYKAAHSAMRYLLSAYLDMQPNEIKFEAGEYGKPYLTNHPLHFNLSHSGNHALLGVTRDNPIGLDIEVFSKRDYQGIAKHSFSETEQVLLSEMSEHLLPSGFFRIWTQKEAFIKLSGQGLNYPLNAFSVSPRSPDTLLSIHDEDHAHFMMDAFEISPGLVGAVCLKAAAPEIHHYRFVYPLNSSKQRD